MEDEEEEDSDPARNDPNCSKSIKYASPLFKSGSSLNLTSTPLIATNSTLGWEGRRQWRGDQSGVCQCHSASAEQMNSRRLGVKWGRFVWMGVEWEVEVMEVWWVEEGDTGTG